MNKISQGFDYVAAGVGERHLQCFDLERNDFHKGYRRQARQ
jgi:hypothetical protein